MGEQSWTDHPRLRSWLQRQESSFPTWTATHPGNWDFTPASLDALESAVRADFADWDAAWAARDATSLTVPAWYLGEVCVRAGAVWKVNPAADTDPDGPAVAIPDDPAESDSDRYEDEDYRPAVLPVAELRDLFLKPPDWRLHQVPAAFTEWYRAHS
ncbi:hypothetical protein [Actinokineospora inagensis]|uniref:hypothetical protein n=1 Tax=Actinokineospora inagensis TaxID=103730 RepID=UPI0012FB8165|nr:hypothetical protein [Actinokineospora inagensis]